MFKLIRFFFWMVTVVILAYFMADLKIGGKTIKENIDEFLSSPRGSEVTTKAREWVDTKVDQALEKTKEKIMDTVHEPDKPPPQPTKPEEEVTPSERKELDQIFQKHS